MQEVLREGITRWQKEQMQPVSKIDYEDKKETRVLGEYLIP